ncbi:MAG: hypothetical protein ABII88_09980 [Candidatus Omnitrophota bacterium]
MDKSVKMTVGITMLLLVLVIMFGIKNYIIAPDKDAAKTDKIQSRQNLEKLKAHANNMPVTARARIIRNTDYFPKKDPQRKKVDPNEMTVPLEEQLLKNLELRPEMLMGDLEYSSIAEPMPEVTPEQVTEDMMEAVKLENPDTDPEVLKKIEQMYKENMSKNMPK